jgi:hypothetical protein
MHVVRSWVKLPAASVIRQAIRYGTLVRQPVKSRTVVSLMNCSFHPSGTFINLVFLDEMEPIGEAKAKDAPDPSNDMPAAAQDWWVLRSHYDVWMFLH